jgi:hypothetical protein
MRSVGLKTLKNKLSEYVRLAAAGETTRSISRRSSFSARGQAVELATYDNRMLLAAQGLGVPLAAL